MSIAIENVDIHGWEAAIRGARNPLVPPHHGKLIDASGIWTLLYDYADSIGVPDIICFDKIMEAAFSHAPTIIPESKEGEI